MMLIYSQSYQVRPAEVDVHDRLTLPSFLDLFQDLAGHHAEILGFGMEKMLSRGVAWVLNRLVVEVETLPLVTEHLRLETWPSGLDRLYAHRDVLAYGADGRVIARGTTRWLTIDVEKRRPLRGDGSLSRMLPQDQPPALVPEDRRAGAFEPAGTRTITVRFSDLDVNGHANNVHYARWIAEAFDDAFLRENRQASLDLTVRAETFRGDVLRSEVSAQVDDGWYQHRILRESDGREVATAWSRWAHLA